MSHLFSLADLGRERRELVPGAVHVPGWATLQQQRWIVDRFHEWADGPVPLRAATVRGHQMSVRTVCLGWHWRPYEYTREATDVNGRRVLAMPDWLVRLGQQALTEAYGDRSAAAAYVADTALVNFYDDEARMGMHADREERSPAPVVSLSLGASCVFRFGNAENRGRPYTDVPLESGDLFVFGGPARLAYHGVPRTLPGTGPDGIGLPSGRLNVTLRESGLTDPV